MVIARSDRIPSLAAKISEALERSSADLSISGHGRRLDLKDVLPPSYAAEPAIGASAIAPLHIVQDCRIDALLALVDALNDQNSGFGVRISTRDLMIKALAKAIARVCQTHPLIADRSDGVSISSMVNFDNRQIFAIVRSAALQPVSGIAGSIAAQVEDAISGRQSDSFQCEPVASVYDLTGFGIEQMVLPLVAPLAIAVSIGAAVEEAEPGQDLPTSRLVTKVTASFDPQIIDVPIAAKLMAVFRDLVEAPYALLA